MISLKQKKILAFSYTKFDALICDGAIRSGKTSLMTVAFVDWAMREFNNISFAICGKTVGSAIKNIVIPYLTLAYSKKYNCRLTRSDNKLVVSAGGKTNTFYIYGGKDESSYMLIQGITLGGVLLDEVALMTRSFVEQALARCSVLGSKFWFNCNPESPNHWFYVEWIKDEQPKKHNALHLHFLIDDNPSLSDSIKQRYESMYSGVFYDRYIKGEWTIADGLVYPMFNLPFHVVPTIPRPYQKYYISIDYGTQNPCSMGLWGLANGKWYRVREYYYSGRDTNMQKTDEEYYAELVKLAGNLIISKVVVDPSAASFIETIKRHGKFRVEKAVNDVLNGIQNVATHLKQGDLLFNDCCVDTIKEFQVYSWDSKAKEDSPIKKNDHAMDDIRYFVNTVLDNKRIAQAAKGFLF